MKNINRLNQESLARALTDASSRDVILVQGARQVGKTTLIEQTLTNRRSVFSLNLERDPSSLRDIDRTTSFDQFTKFLQAHFKTAHFDHPDVLLFIDEAQESEKIGGYIRFMKEEWRHARVVMSGSSMTRIFLPAMWDFGAWICQALLQGLPCFTARIAMQKR